MYVHASREGLLEFYSNFTTQPVLVWDLIQCLCLDGAEAVSGTHNSLHVLLLSLTVTT